MKAYTGLIKRMEDVKNPYPENIFIPISKNEWKKINDIITKEMGFPLDRVSGNLMRMGWDISRQRMVLEVQEFIHEKTEMK